RPKKDFADLGFRLDDVEQARAIDLQHFARLPCTAPDRAAAPGQNIQFSGKFSGPVQSHDGFTVRRAPVRRTYDLNTAFDQHKKRSLGQTLIPEQFSFVRMAPVAEEAEARDLRGVELRKHRLALPGGFRHAP